MPILPPGTLLNGCYRLRRVLGAGGMGYVYEAHDEALNRLVAVKMSRPDTPADTIIHEARVMAAFRHPGLPTVHAMGMHEDNHYVVMERLAGRSLAEYMEASGRIDADEAHEILLAIAESLEILHRATLVHRDLKPSNIMLVPPDRLVLFDFGICDLERFAGGGDDIIGTKHYIAPEAVTGAIRPGDAHLTDVYALGVIGYQLLAAQTPFQGNSVTEVLTRVVEEEPPHLAELRPDVSPPLVELITQMLSKDPGERPPVAMVRAQLEHMSSPFQARRLAQQRADRPIRILIADCEPGIWSLVSYVLEDRGYELVRVSDGARALEAFTRSGFDIVITASSVVGLDGLELLRAIKQRSPATDVIVIATGRGRRGADALARRAGAAAYLERPLDLDILASIVRRIATRHRALHKHRSIAG